MGLELAWQWPYENKKLKPRGSEGEFCYERTHTASCSELKLEKMRPNLVKVLAHLLLHVQSCYSLWLHISSSLRVCLPALGWFHSDIIPGAGQMWNQTGRQSEVTSEKHYTDLQGFVLLGQKSISGSKSIAEVLRWNCHRHELWILKLQGIVQVARQRADKK